jgi:hypothetical protein
LLSTIAISRFLFVSISMMSMTAISRKFRLLRAGLYARTGTGVELPKEVFTSRVR